MRRPGMNPECAIDNWTSISAHHRDRRPLPVDAPALSSHDPCARLLSLGPAGYLADVCHDKAPGNAAAARRRLAHTPASPLTHPGSFRPPTTRASGCQQGHPMGDVRRDARVLAQSVESDYGCSREMHVVYGASRLSVHGGRGKKFALFARARPYSVGPAARSLQEQKAHESPVAQ